jgi:hypothetical protein
MSEEEWRIVNALVNFCRNNGLTTVEAEHENFSISLKADDEGFNLSIERINLNGGLTS